MTAVGQLYGLTLSVNCKLYWPTIIQKNVVNSCAVFKFVTSTSSPLAADQCCLCWEQKSVCRWDSRRHHHHQVESQFYCLAMNQLLFRGRFSYHLPLLPSRHFSDFCQIYSFFFLFITSSLSSYGSLLFLTVISL